MRRRVAAGLVGAALCAFAPAANADEIVETTDGRKLLLRSDGGYEMLSRFDRALMQRALAAARQWAQDQTLVSYCLRDNLPPQQFARNFAMDRDQALARLRRGGATEAQLHEVATAIAEGYRPPPAGEDAARTAECAAKEVEKNVFIISGIGLPLFLRPPFNELK